MVSAVDGDVHVHLEPGMCQRLFMTHTRPPQIVAQYRCAQSTANVPLTLFLPPNHIQTLTTGPGGDAYFHVDDQTAFAFRAGDLGRLFIGQALIDDLILEPVVVSVMERRRATAASLPPPPAQSPAHASLPTPVRPPASETTTPTTPQEPLPRPPAARSRQWSHFELWLASSAICVVQEWGQDKCREHLGVAICSAAKQLLEDQRVDVIEVLKDVLQADAGKNQKVVQELMSDAVNLFECTLKRRPQLARLVNSSGH
jgi:hypothetical protein